MKMNVRHLIAEVKQRQPLWDRKHEFRNERALIEALWDEIAVVMGRPQKEVKNKWKTMKDTYRKEAKKLHNNPNHRTAWCYFSSLHFLYDQLGLEPQDPLTDPNCSTSKIESDHDTKIEFVYDNLELPTDNTEMSNSSKDSCSNKRKLDDDELASDLLESSDCMSKSNDSFLEDEDLCFFKSLVPHVKQLSPQKKMLLRMKIQEMVYKEVYYTDL